MQFAVVTSLLMRAQARLVLARERLVLAKGETHEIFVPAGPAGQPGERVLAPARALYSPRLTPDGAREDFRVLLSQDGTSFASVCLGTVADRGNPEDNARSSLARRKPATGSLTNDLSAETIAGESAVRYRIHLRWGPLTEWKFSHRGWLFVVGVLDRGNDPNAAVASAREVLSTWEWVD